MCSLHKLAEVYRTWELRKPIKEGMKYGCCLDHHVLDIEQDYEEVKSFLFDFQQHISIRSLNSLVLDNPPP